MLLRTSSCLRNLPSHLQSACCNFEVTVSQRSLLVGKSHSLFPFPLYQVLDLHLLQISIRLLRPEKWSVQIQVSSCSWGQLVIEKDFWVTLRACVLFIFLYISSILPSYKYRKNNFLKFERILDHLLFHSFLPFRSACNLSKIYNQNRQL